MMEIKEFTREEQKALLLSLGEPAYREKQLFKWISRGVQSFEEMLDLPKSLREKLSASCTFQTLSVAVEQSSERDGTRKFLLKLPDGNTVEAVFMKYEYGNSLCLSTQVGCGMGCTFCASGIGGKARNLKAWEMLYEFLICQKQAGEIVNHVVLMGTGEPFDNYFEVAEFLRRIHDPEGINLSYRNITVSTCGIIPVIEKFGNDFPQVNLAISLHAATQEEREVLMPVAKAYKLPELIDACRKYTKKTGRRITFEYALIAEKNDSQANARQLAKLLEGMLCHVNIIPLNPVSEAGLCGSDRRRAEEFSRLLEKLGIPSTVRRQLGADIDAACGQLRRKNS